MRAIARVITIQGHSEKAANFGANNESQREFCHRERRGADKCDLGNEFNILHLQGSDSLRVDSLVVHPSSKPGEELAYKEVVKEPKP